MNGLTRPVPIWAAFLLVLVSSAITLAIAAVVLSDDGRDAPSLAQETAPTSTAEPAPDWRQAEYAKIGKLRGGLSLAYFQEVLGTAMFITPSKDEQFTEYLFRGRDYWVQAVSDTRGSVQLMAITSCAADFRPRFQGVSGAYPQLGTLILQQTKLGEVAADPTYVRYFTSGATANSYYYDEYYFGNPGLYKTYFVGINDACPYKAANDSRLPFLTSAYLKTNFRPEDQAVKVFRADAVANTYAETGPSADQRALEAFQIGASRILTRTAPPWTNQRSPGTLGPPRLSNSRATTRASGPAPTPLPVDQVHQPSLTRRAEVRPRRHPPGITGSTP